MFEFLELCDLFSLPLDIAFIADFNFHLFGHGLRQVRTPGINVLQGIISKLRSADEVRHGDSGLEFG